MTDQAISPGKAISPLRRRMIEDMTIRKLAPKTQHDYVQRVNDFAAFLGRSPDAAQSEDVRRFRPASDVKRRRHAKDQCYRVGAAVLLQSDARSPRPH